MSTAKLTLEGKEYELPVTVGSEGEVAVDITKLRATSGAITLDPGYGNTGSCQSAVTFIDGELTVGMTDVDDYDIETTATPARFALHQNEPNPFNPVTTIRYDLPEACHTNLRVYDVRGREVAVLVDDSRPAGRHAIEWNADHVASGIYFYRLEAATYGETRKLILLK